MDTFNKTENLGTTTIPDATLWIIAVWYDNSGKGVVTEWTDDFFAIDECLKMGASNK